ncbi:hypothetical protein LTR85_006230 [Meristemomyces frigidus]|nr:hypothetical protein LTR85_006230 [Meristemomyces frigidus]
MSLTATFHQLHEALQVAFGWASTHTYDLNVLDPEFDTTQDDSADAMVNMIRQMTQGTSASDPREYVLRIKDDRSGMDMIHVDRMHDRNRQHPRTKEKSGLKTKLFQVLDAPEYRDERIVYTYDFGDRWEHTLTLMSRAPASATFSCTEGSGHGVAEDVVQDGWQPLVEAYRAARPNKEQKEKRRWYERDCSNGDRLGLGEGRERIWDKDDVNRRLERVKCG